MAQTLQILWELLPAVCFLFEVIQRKRTLLGSFECACGRAQPAGSETPETGFGLRHQEEGLGFCLGFLGGTCVVSILAFHV